MNSNASILETPATVSVITREELDVRGVQDIETVVARSPNVAVIDYPGGQGAPTDPAWKGAVISVNALSLFDQRYFTASTFGRAPAAGGDSETPGNVVEGFRRQVFGTLTCRR